MTIITEYADVCKIQNILCIKSSTLIPRILMIQVDDACHGNIHLRIATSQAHKVELIDVTWPMQYISTYSFLCEFMLEFKHYLHPVYQKYDVSCCMSRHR